ncbi:unnamed protein product [Porites evermanni]|uniref:Uncharacterized protein n=1 Tax=Porites evermanni TaxID=104178 RepID=A0ABN8SM80_9CNID|nr:unnamed protein product [Porites evermanni]
MARKAAEVTLCISERLRLSSGHHTYGSAARPLRPPIKDGVVLKSNEHLLLDCEQILHADFFNLQLEGTPSLEPYFLVLGTVLPQSFTGAFSSNSRLGVRQSWELKTVPSSRIARENLVNYDDATIYSGTSI